MPAESLIKRTSRMSEIVLRLKKEYPESKCSLLYNSPFQLLVATILSAQCTDERVNRVTKVLFSKYPTVKSFFRLSLSSLKKEIFSTGFYNNKAKSIKGMAKAVMELHGGEVPNTLEDMVKLPGVGRKTANVVLGNVYAIPSLVVDTHVTRISNLLKFVKSKNAVIIEKELMKVVIKRDWTIFSHLLIDHGRKICIANRPKCQECILNDLCPSCK
ncbi:MAG: endonuclease III [Candidatus Neomarinimicrobiota bacterium]|nr:endonuclease III [Candidatus Neomarinimicrobiota bacterium]